MGQPRKLPDVVGGIIGDALSGVFPGSKIPTAEVVSSMMRHTFGEVATRLVSPFGGYYGGGAGRDALSHLYEDPVGSLRNLVTTGVAFPPPLGAGADGGTRETNLWRKGFGLDEIQPWGKQQKSVVYDDKNRTYSYVPHSHIWSSVKDRLRNEYGWAFENNNPPDNVLLPTTANTDVRYSGSPLHQNLTAQIDDLWDTAPHQDEVRELGFFDSGIFARWLADQFSRPYRIRQSFNLNQRDL